jgi:hypothetical protein
MSELARFQSAFAEALTGDAAGLAPWLADASAEPRLAVYRNTVAKGCADAVAAQFPTLVRGVGEAWLRDAAVIFARGHPPVSASLADYGAAFPAWLADFPPAADLPWLAGLARIDWAWRAALFAEDRPALTARAFAALTPEDHASLGAELHPAAQLLWFDDGTPSLWQALQADDAAAGVELSPAPEGLLVTRPELTVLTLPLGSGGHAFLAACRAGRSLAAAGEAALAAQPGLALAALFPHLIGAGAFARIQTPRSDVS